MELADIWNWLLNVYYEFAIRIFNISISASFFALAVILFRFVFKKSPKWLIVALWALVAIRLVCPFSIESAMSLIPSAETIPLEQMLGNGAQATDTISFDIVKNPHYTEFAGSGSQAALTGFNILPVIFGMNIWFFGAFAMLLYALISFIRLRYTVRTAIPSKENVWLSDDVKSPFILGVFRPRIYLPSDMDENTAELVLRHERAHIKRRDHLWKPFGFMLLALHWFNPVLWLSYILLCRDIELACDEKVIKDMENNDKKAYSEALLSCSASHRMISACPVAFGEVGVKKRIKSVLNYKKPAFWLIFIALVASVVIALCFMTDPKSENGGAVTFDGVDEISELTFPMEKILYDTASFTIYNGNSTTDDYFEAKSEDIFCFREVSSFLEELDLTRIVDGDVDTMTEPQTNAVIEIRYSDPMSLKIIFHDNYTKIYMNHSGSGVYTRSKDYSVENHEEAKKFFTEKPYMQNSLVWEYNLASSAWGHSEIVFWLDSKYQINGKVKGDGKIATVTNETTGVEGVCWMPEILDAPVEYNIEIPVVRNGEESVFGLTITMVGKKALSSYFTIRAENLVIATGEEPYKFVLSEPETKEPVSDFTGFYDLEAQLFEQDAFVNLLMTSPVFIKNGEKEAVVYNGEHILGALDVWEFEKGFYSHPSGADLWDMRKYSIEVDADQNRTYIIYFNKDCSLMWFSDNKGGYTSTFKVKNSKTVKAFFDEEKFFEESFVWEYNPSANTYGLNFLRFVTEGEYGSYTATCENGSFRKAEIKKDKIGGIIQTDATKQITCTKEDNLVWTPDGAVPLQDTIHVEIDGNTSDFYVYINQLGTNYSGHAIYEITADYAKVTQTKQGSNVAFSFEQTYDITWLYKPMNSGTWFYIAKFLLPEGYEIKSAEASRGTATIENRYYNSSDNEKLVCWSPDENAEADAELTINAVKDGKQQEFRIFINYTGSYHDTGNKKYIISPINCKLLETETATFYIEER